MRFKMTTSLNSDLDQYNFLGVGTLIQEGDDLDDYLTPGVYTSISTDVTKTLKHVPADVSGGFRLEVAYRTSKNYLTHTLYANSGVIKIYTRTRNESTFIEWEKNIVQSDLTPYYSLNDAVVIPKNADLNDYTEPGNYISTGESISSTLKNCPITHTGFMLHVERTTGDTSQYKKQRIVANQAVPLEYWRTLNEGTWKSWGSPVLTHNIQVGRENGIKCPPEEITIQHVDFPAGFFDIPHVIVSIYSASTSINYADLTVTAHNISKAGFDIRLYNRHTTELTPGVTWIAVAL